MKKTLKTQAALTTQPAAARLEAARPDSPNHTTAVNGKPLELAARGAEKDCHDAFKVFAGMSLEEIRLTRRACWRLEEWCDSYLIGNVQGL